MLKQFEEELNESFDDSHTFWDVLEDFIQHRKELKAPLTPMAVTKLCNKFNRYSANVCKNAMDRAIINGWRGVFPESEIDNKGLDVEPDNPMDMLVILHKRYGSFKLPGFSGGIHSPLASFYERLVLPAIAIVEDTDLEITGQLFTMYANVCTDEDANWRFPVHFILGCYIDWLRGNNWVTAPAANVFNIDGKLFKKFVRYYSVALNNRTDILTGKYINGST